MHEWTMTILHYIKMQTNGVDLEGESGRWGCVRVCVWESVRVCVTERDRERERAGLSVYNLYVHIAIGDITAQRSQRLLTRTHTCARTCTHAERNVSPVVYQDGRADQWQPLAAQWCHGADEEMASEEFDVILRRPHLLFLRLVFLLLVGHSPNDTVLAPSAAELAIKATMLRNSLTMRWSEAPNLSCLWSTHFTSFLLLHK